MASTSTENSNKPSFISKTLISVNELPPEFRCVFSNYSYFNRIQSAIFQDVFHTDKSMVVSAPTGSGKTVAFELAIVKILNSIQNEEDNNFKIIYVAPMKALCEERLLDWHKKFADFNLNCISVTGDTEIISVNSLTQHNVIITTPEKWDSLTRRWRNNYSFVEAIKLFMVDEVHLLNDEARGPTLEAIICRMKTIQSTLVNKKIRFITVSATIPNIDDIAAWIGSPSNPAKYYSFGDEMRPVKLNKIVNGYQYNPQTSTPFKFDLMLNYKLQSILLQYSDGKPTVIFCSTRKSVEMTAKHLTQNITVRLTPAQSEVLKATSAKIQDASVRGLLIHGIACHHAGMLPDNRNTVEALFRSGQLPVLVTTSTLAMGVNLPAHLVIIKSTKYYTKGEYRDYPESTLLQMIGRAGRPQFDTFATAVIMTTATDKLKFENMVSGGQPIESSLHRHLTEHLNAEVVLRTITDLAVAMQWINSTFLYIRARKHPKYYGLSLSLTTEQIDKKLLEMCQIVINKLIRVGMITMDQNITIMPTNIGILMAKFYVNFETMKLFKEAVRGTEVLSQILAIISRCFEFTDLYLRSTDKKSLNILNKCKDKETIRFPLSGKIKTLDMKINCIIQAVFGSLQIVESSLQNEAQKIMRTGERVSNCLAEYLETKPNCYSALLNAITLAKCFHARLWENSPYVSRQLSGIGAALSANLVAAGKTSFPAILEANPRNLEVILHRKAPMGNNIQTQVERLPQYSMSFNEIKVDLNTSRINVAINLHNYTNLQDELAIDPESVMSLLIGDHNNNVLCYEKYTHTYMVSNPEIIKDLDNQFTSETKIFAHFISDSWVGIDCECKIVLFPKFDMTAKKDVPKIQKTQNVSAKNKLNAKLNINENDKPHVRQFIDQYYKITKMNPNPSSSTTDAGIVGQNCINQQIFKTNNNQEASSVSNSDKVVAIKAINEKNCNTIDSKRALHDINEIINSGLKQDKFADNSKLMKNNVNQRQIETQHMPQPKNIHDKKRLGEIINTDLEIETELLLESFETDWDDFEKIDKKLEEKLLESSDNPSEIGKESPKNQGINIIENEIEERDRVEAQILKEAKEMCKDVQTISDDLFEEFENEIPNDAFLETPGNGMFYGDATYNRDLEQFMKNGELLLQKNSEADRKNVKVLSDIKLNVSLRQDLVSFEKQIEQSKKSDDYSGRNEIGSNQIPKKFNFKKIGQANNKMQPQNESDEFKISSIQTSNDDSNYAHEVNLNLNNDMNEELGKRQIDSFKRKIEDDYIKTRADKGNYKIIDYHLGKSQDDQRFFDNTKEEMHNNQSFFDRNAKSAEEIQFSNNPTNSPTNYKSREDLAAEFRRKHSISSASRGFPQPNLEKYVLSESKSNSEKITCPQIRYIFTKHESSPRRNVGSQSSWNVSMSSQNRASTSKVMKNTNKLEPKKEFPPIIHNFSQYKYVPKKQFSHNNSQTQSIVEANEADSTNCFPSSPDKRLKLDKDRKSFRIKWHSPLITSPEIKSSIKKSHEEYVHSQQGNFKITSNWDLPSTSKDTTESNHAFESLRKNMQRVSQQNVQQTFPSYHTHFPIRQPKNATKFDITDDEYKTIESAKVGAKLEKESKQVFEKYSGLLSFSKKGNLPTLYTQDLGSYIKEQSVIKAQEKESNKDVKEISFSLSGLSEAFNEDFDLPNPDNISFDAISESNLNLHNNSDERLDPNQSMGDENQGIPYEFQFQNSPKNDNYNPIFAEQCFTDGWESQNNYQNMNQRSFIQIRPSLIESNFDNSNANEGLNNGQKLDQSFAHYSTPQMHSNFHSKNGDGFKNRSKSVRFQNKPTQNWPNSDQIQTTFGFEATPETDRFSDEAAASGYYNIPNDDRYTNQMNPNRLQKRSSELPYFGECKSRNMNYADKHPDHSKYLDSFNLTPNESTFRNSFQNPRHVYDVQNFDRQTNQNPNRFQNPSRLIYSNEFESGSINYNNKKGNKINKAIKPYSFMPNEASFRNTFQNPERVFDRQPNQNRFQNPSGLNYSEEFQSGCLNYTEKQDKYVDKAKKPFASTQNEASLPQAIINPNVPSDYLQNNTNRNVYEYKHISDDESQAGASYQRNRPNDGSNQNPHTNFDPNPRQLPTNHLYYQQNPNYNKHMTANIDPEKYLSNNISQDPKATGVIRRQKLAQLSRNQQYGRTENEPLQQMHDSTRFRQERGSFVNETRRGPSRSQANYHRDDLNLQGESSSRNYQQMYNSQRLPVNYNQMQSNSIFLENYNPNFLNQQQREQSRQFHKSNQNN